MTCSHCTRHRWQSWSWSCVCVTYSSAFKPENAPVMFLLKLIIWNKLKRTKSSNETTFLHVIFHLVPTVQMQFIIIVLHPPLQIIRIVWIRQKLSRKFLILLRILTTLPGAGSGPWDLTNDDDQHKSIERRRWRRWNQVKFYLWIYKKIHNNKIT